MSQSLDELVESQGSLRRVYGIFLRGVLVASVQKTDDIEWPTICVWTTREAAHAHIEENLRKGKGYYVGEIEVIA